MKAKVEVARVIWMIAQVQFSLVYEITIARITRIKLSEKAYFLRDTYFMYVSVYFRRATQFSIRQSRVLNLQKYLNVHTSQASNIHTLLDRFGITNLFFIASSLHHIGFQPGDIIESIWHSDYVYCNRFQIRLHSYSSIMSIGQLSPLLPSCPHVVNGHFWVL